MATTEIMEMETVMEMAKMAIIVETTTGKEKTTETIMVKEKEPMETTVNI
jgi:hypothetical protein